MAGFVRHRRFLRSLLFLACVGHAERLLGLHVAHHHLDMLRWTLSGPVGALRAVESASDKSDDVRILVPALFEGLLPCVARVVFSHSYCSLFW